MSDTEQLVQVLDRRVERRNERRDLFRYALGATVGAGAFAFASRAVAQSGPSDTDILNFALNLEYLEAQFYAYAAGGAGLAASLQTPGSAAPAGGAQGAVVTGSGGGQPRAVSFDSSADAQAVRQYAREIAADELAHVTFLRRTLDTRAVAQPAINISGGTGGAFTAAAQAAGLIRAEYAPAGVDVAAGTFDPYANHLSFLLAAFIFEDVGVTAYKGAAPLIQNKTFLQAAAGILSVEANHAAIVRTSLAGIGMTVPELVTAAGQISDLRDLVDGSTDLDQGIASTTVSNQAVSNIVPTNSDGICFSRTPGQVLNIVYLDRRAVSMGGFFPAGVNGTIRAAASN